MYITLLLGIYVNVTTLTCWGYDQILDIGLSLLVIDLSPFYFQYLIDILIMRIIYVCLCEIQYNPCVSSLIVTSVVIIIVVVIIGRDVNRLMI